MKEIENQKVREIQLQILEFFHNFCVNNSLNYVLAYGTLLGAIRHKGYIPWDDDIDVVMPRNDYEKFVVLLNDSKYKLIDCQIDSNFYLPFGKLYDSTTIKKEDVILKKASNLGVDIDIFALDYFDNINDIVICQKKVEKLYYKLYFSYSNYKKDASIKSLIRRIIRIPFRYKYNAYSKKMLSIAKSKSLQYGKYCSNISDPFTAHRKKFEFFPAEIFEKKVLASFEGKFFYIPQNYDIFLKTVYGDYMTLPPESKRQTHHTYKCFYK